MKQILQSTSSNTPLSNNYFRFPSPFEKVSEGRMRRFKEGAGDGWRLVLVFLLLSFTSQAQQKFTISGYVKDASNGEYSIGANVYIKETFKGGTTNQYGFYSITVEKGTYHLVSTYVGYQNFEQEIVLDKDLRIT